MTRRYIRVYSGRTEWLAGWLAGTAEKDFFSQARQSVLLSERDHRSSSEWKIRNKQGEVNFERKGEKSRELYRSAESARLFLEKEEL